MAASQIKAVELGFFLHVELLHILLFARSTESAFFFYERCNPFNNMDSLSETDVIQTESPENFVVITH